MTLGDVRALANAIRGEVAKAIVGQDAMIDQLLVALISQGHVLLEGPPGTAKTFLANAFATALGMDFGRIQFTPDLLPGDILGSNLFNFQTSQFTLTRGPIFCELLLADEINRTPPKTQAALLEAMQERRVTLDGETHALPERFMVMATQNPIENQGVYPLPEAQLDRFLFKVLVGYPSREEEAKIVTRYGQRHGPSRAADLGVPIEGLDTALRALVKGSEVATVTVDDRSVPVMLQSRAGTVRNPQDLLGLSVRSASGRPPPSVSPCGPTHAGQPSSQSHPATSAAAPASSSSVRSNSRVDNPTPPGTDSHRYTTGRSECGDRTCAVMPRSCGSLISSTQATVWSALPAATRATSSSSRFQPCAASSRASHQAVV